MNVAYLTNASRESGIGHRAYHVRLELEKQPDIQLTDIKYNPNTLPFRPWPGALGSKSVNWIRWGRKLQMRADVYDITNQTLAFLAKRFSPTVLTVHDIIEVLEPQDKRAALINAYLYSGIPKAQHIIAVSEYTKRAVIERYDVRASNITVVPNGVGGEFHPIPQFADSIGFQELRRELKLGDAHPLVLYVGSDHPRKNLPVALEVFAKLRKQRSDAVFLKVGEPGMLAGREATLAAVDRLGIKNAVRFLGNVSYEKLNLLYNLADALLYPSTFEGFGLPPLQAMAAGLPVVTSNVTSLPEVVGDAAITHDPHDIESLFASVQKVTSDQHAVAEYRRRGINRAKTFTWEKAAKQVAGIYKKLARR